MHAAYWADNAPDRAAIVMGSGLVRTYGELGGRSRQLARLLREAGLRRGDHIAVVMENDPVFFEAVWSALQTGLYITPVNRHLTADEVAYILEDSDAKAVVVSGSLAGVAGGIDFTQLSGVGVRLVVGGTIDGFEDYETAIARFAPEPLEDESPGSAMLYTSGTTGRPKGVLRPLPEGDVNATDPLAAGLSLVFGLGEETMYLSPAPLYHAAPLAFTTAVHRVGGTVVVMERFDPTEALRLIEAHKVTHSQWVPTMLIRLLGLPEEVRNGVDLSSHTLAIHAAAPCPPDVKRKMIDWWGPILIEYYSGTDSGGMTVINSTEWLAHPGSVGRSSKVRIVGDDGHEVPTGEVGTVYFVGGPKFAYKGDATKTEATRLPGGLRTMGDCGYVDEDGFLYLTDRKDFMILSGGVNIYPRETEDVLIGHPAVDDVAVIGVPHPELGEEVKAVVQLAAGVAATPELVEELIGLCRSRLAPYKCPRSVDFVAELPRTPAGKLLKRLVRDPYWACVTTAAESEGRG
jgi:fatty-acyl-CoA synthase